MLAIYLLFGIFLGTVNPPITNTAVSGMRRWMVGVAASLASAGWPGSRTRRTEYDDEGQAAPISRIPLPLGPPHAIISRSDVFSWQWPRATMKTTDPAAINAATPQSDH